MGALRDGHGVPPPPVPPVNQWSLVGQKRGSVDNIGGQYEDVYVKTPVGSLREELKPQCLPPGVTRPPRVEREVDVRLPHGIGAKGRQTQGEEKPRDEPERD